MSQLGGGAGGDAGRCQRPVTVAECRPSGPGDERRLLGEKLFVELADGVRTGRRAAVPRQDCPWLLQCHQAFDVTRAGPLDEEPPQVLHDLVEFFRNEELLDEATSTREAAVAAAQRDYDTTVTAARQRQAECLRKLSDRGERIEDLTALTGLTATEVRKALRVQPAAPAPSEERETVPPEATEPVVPDSEPSAPDAAAEERALTSTSVA